jgi:hypothetical protein
MKINSIQIIFLISLIIISSERDTNGLIFVYEHARHGARGPSSGYQSYFKDGEDEYKVRWDLDGELSAIGKRQHYFLGVRNRLRYKNLINFEKYNPMEILIHATDYNRTHQSINSELLGMYGNYKEENLTQKEKDEYEMVNNKYLKESNPELYDRINKELDSIGNQVNGKSIPIFNIRRFKNGRIFLVDHCTKLDQYRDQKVGSTVRKLYDEFEEKYSEKFKNFFNHPEYFRDYNKMKSITDHYVCDYDNKKDLRVFTDNKIDKEEFLNFSKRFYGNFIFNWFIDEYTSGLESTHLMQDLLGYMDSRIKYKDKITYKAPKMVMDCGHDTTVGPIARYMSSAFNIPYHQYCEFACNVYYELYIDERKSSGYSVSYLLDDELLIDRMDYNEFKDKLKSKFWNDTYMSEFCGKEEDTYINKKSKLENYSTTLFEASILFTFLFILAMTMTFFFYAKLKILERKLKEEKLTKEILGGNEENEEEGEKLN